MPYLASIKLAENLKDKRVLVRCDFDVPLSAGRIEDDSRLKASLLTIKFLLKKKCQIILMGHLGRPNGKVVGELSLKPVQEHLEKLLKTKIELIKFGEISSSINLKRDKKDKIIMLENLRFWLGEEKNDKKFARQLASWADVYVNEAFAVSHRACASVDAIKNYLPSYAGFNLTKEVEKLSEVLNRPLRPLVVIIGGAKIETKLPVLDKFLAKADYLLVGGAIVNNFFKILNYEVGQSLIDREYLAAAKKLWQKSKSGALNFIIKDKQFSVSNGFISDKLDLATIKNLRHKIILPIDVAVKNLKTEEKEIKAASQVNLNDKILDIGPQTLELYGRIIKGARCVVWNGPMGKFEESEFAVGTFCVAELIIKARARAIIGGGETEEALKSVLKNKELPKRIFVSTGGGAMLEFLGGKKLPGLQK
ncbi:MAG TPA: phosphoglycerate kinase [bacterium]|nr:phosphoglycerate kinase [bacterium]